MGTWGCLSSGVNCRPMPSTRAMYSLCVMTAPHVEYRSVRNGGVPCRKSAGVSAEALKPSILPHSDLNSASVMSLAQHLALAGAVALAGEKGAVHLAFSCVTLTMFGRRRQIALVVAAHELLVGREDDVALDDAGAHARPREHRLPRLLGGT